VERIYLSSPAQSAREVEALQRVCASNWLAPVGLELEAFEAEMGAYTGCGHPLAVNAGTTALRLIAQALKGPRKGVVLAPSFTFIGTVSAFLQTGVEVWFLDTCPQTWGVLPEALDDAIAVAQDEGRPIAALVSAPVYGLGEDGFWLRSKADALQVPWICDAAEAVGVRVANEHVGVTADATVFSFNGNKILTTAGGGMVCTPHEHWAERMRLLAQQGRAKAWHYEHTIVGENARLSNVLAALGRAQLAELEANIERRRAIRKRYEEALGDLPGVRFMPTPAPEVRSNHWLTCLSLKPAETHVTPLQLGKALEDANIESRPLWKPLHLQPALRGCRFFGPGVCEDLFAHGIALPSGSGLTLEEQARVIEVVQHTLGSAA